MGQGMSILPHIHHNYRRRAVVEGTDRCEPAAVAVLCDTPPQALAINLLFKGPLTVETNRTTLPMCVPSSILSVVCHLIQPGLLIYDPFTHSVQ